MLLRPRMCAYAMAAASSATTDDDDDDTDSNDFRGRRMDCTYRETIHSGHFMVSDIDPEDDDEDGSTVAATTTTAAASMSAASSVDDDILPLSSGVAAAVLSDDSSSRDDTINVVGQLLPHYGGRILSGNGGYDFEAATKETANTYNFGPRSSKSVSIDATLTKLFRCMTLAYSGKLTSPRWKTFKGMKLRWKDKIRLNNVIWRAWHMQFVQRRRPMVCTFANPVEDNHVKPAAVVLEGKYWKRQTDTVRAEYKSWRVSTQKTDLRHRGEYVNPASLDPNLYEWQPLSNQSAYSSSSMLIDDDTFGEYSDRLFNCLITSHPYPFPTPKELGKSSNSDLIQPGLVQFQPNLDDFMDTIDVWSQRLPPVLEENDLATVSSVLNSSAPQQQLQNNSAFPGMEMMGIIGQQQQQQQQSSPIISTKPIVGPISVPPRQSTSRANFNQNFQPKVYPPSSNELSSSRNSGLSNTGTSRYAADPAVHKMDGTEASDVPPLMDLHMMPSLMVKEETSQQRQTPASIYSASSSHQQQQSYLSPQSPPQLRQQTESPTDRRSPIHGGSSMNSDANSQRALVMHSSHSVTSSPPHLLPSPPPTLSPPGKYMGGGGHHQQQHHHQHQKQQRHDHRFTYDSSPGKHHNSFPMSPPRSQMVGPPLRTSSSLISIASVASSASSSAAGSGAHVRRSSVGYDRGNRLQRKDDEMFVVPKPKGRTRSRSGSSLGHLQQQQQQQTARTSPPALIAPLPPPLPPPPPPPPLPPQSRQVQTSSSSCGALLAQLLSTGPFSATVDKVIASRNSSPVAIQPSAIAPAVSQTIVVTPVSWPMVPSVNGLQNQVLMGATSKVFGICPSSPVMTSAMTLTTKPTTSLNSTVVTSVIEDRSASTSPKPFRPKSDTEKKQYREHRRVCHINAEQKRRCNIKNGFDTLHHLVPCLSHSPNSKVSKAAMLQKAGEYIKQVKAERTQLQKEAEALRTQIENLNQAINMCQSQLPASGAPVPCQRPNKMQKMFEDYVKERTLQNWKFWLFSRLIQPLLESYNNTVSTASVEDLCKTVLTWLEQHCSLVALRPVVTSSLRHLTMTTNILSDPDQIREEAAKDVK